ncbi:hypothetical protein BDV41DRAFT_586787 [Aspergillus transmontanensis]|uniref:Uncharacterized protein n=1 Tax=Aspergillus transmontanensis TaxID=1034304 RepID=A0A5N6W413_9EURO|nr:hypothetical protein BDV41DRAFT_586787 [Aspergillus transmontanensis]
MFELTFRYEQGGAAAITNDAQLVERSGLNSGKIEFLDNPRNKSEDPNAWTVYQVAKLNTPVAVVPMDITRNGLMDIVVCHDFGDTMIQANMQGGHISWFENPGRDNLKPDVKWTQHYIGRWPAMHRLQAGYFTQRAKGPAGLDSLLVSSREGVSWLYYDDGRWKREQIGTGEQRLPDQLDDSISPGSGDHWGTGSADIGKIGGDTFAYVAAMEPFHSTAITVYIKDNHPIYGRTWRRHVLDNQRNNRVETPTRNFCGNGRNDLVSISYNVKDYYREANPQVALYKNEVCQPPRPRARIVGTLWGNEGMVYLPDPRKMKKNDGPVSRDLIMVANYNIRVEVYPPGSQLRPDGEEGIKVLYGSIGDVDGELKPLWKKPFPRRYNLKTSGGDLSVSQTTGAVILRLKHNGEPTRHWCPQEKVPVENLFNMDDVGLGKLDLKFIQVKDTWWGADFGDAHFFNMTGFHFRFLENKQNIAHMQFWIAGPNVDCRLHDHSDNSFKELHTCLSQGSSQHKETCQGGMWAPKEKYYNEPLDEIKRRRDKCSQGGHKGCQGPCLEDYLEHCPLQPLQEHGRIWHADHYGQTVYRKNKTVSYPGHTWIAGPGPHVDVWMALEFDGKLQL